MTWEEHQKIELPEELFTHRVLVDIDCPECGQKLYKRTDIVLTSYPAQYQYECKCGWIGYSHN